MCLWRWDGVTVCVRVCGTGAISRWGWIRTHGVIRGGDNRTCVVVPGTTVTGWLHETGHWRSSHDNGRLILTQSGRSGRPRIGIPWSLVLVPGLLSEGLKVVRRSSRFDSERGVLESLYFGKLTWVKNDVSLGVPVFSYILGFWDRFPVVEISNFFVVWCSSLRS